MQIQIFGFGEAPRASALGYSIQQLAHGSEAEIRERFAGDLIAVQGPALHGHPGMYEWAIMAPPEPPQLSGDIHSRDGAVINAGKSSRAIAQQYRRKGSMPQGIVHHLYAVREAEIARLAQQSTIRAGDLLSLDRGARASVAALLYERCDVEARHALLHDEHAHVRSCATVSQADPSGTAG